MNIIEPISDRNKFITINLPNALTKNSKYCKSKSICIENSKIGLQLKKNRSNICNKNYVSELACDF